MKSVLITKALLAQAAMVFAMQNRIGNPIFLIALGQHDCAPRHLNVGGQKRENDYH
jgi:hypothetical protein